VVREVRDFVRGLKIPRININPSVIEKLKIPLDAFQRNELSRPRVAGAGARAGDRTAASSRYEHAGSARENERGAFYRNESPQARAGDRNELPRMHVGTDVRKYSHDAKTPHETFRRKDYAGRENERVNSHGNFNNTYEQRRSNNYREQNNKPNRNNHGQRDKQTNRNNEEANNTLGNTEQTYKRTNNTHKENERGVQRKSEIGKEKTGENGETEVKKRPRWSP
jgi:hypothetical protein